MLKKQQSLSRLLQGKRQSQQQNLKDSKEKALRVYQCVIAIPKGCVTTYGSIAKVVGIKNPRLVGRYLHKNPNPETIPCHRVVTAKGQLSRSFAFGGIEGQQKKLEKEGVVVKNGHVDSVCILDMS